MSVDMIRKSKFFVKMKNVYFKLLKPKTLYFIFKSKKPLSSIYGLERGIPVDRYYIETFLNNHRQDIRGNCLELLNNDYTLKYGGRDVIVSDILDIDKNNPKANKYCDIKDMMIIPDNFYDCIILTQVLQFIDDYESAIRECKRILKPHGILLVTLPSLGRIDCAAGIDNDFWRFTSASARYIFNKFFPMENLLIHSYGNILSGLYFWIGAAQEELSKPQLDLKDESFPMLITIRAVK